MFPSIECLSIFSMRSQSVFNTIKMVIIMAGIKELYRTMGKIHLGTVQFDLVFTRLCKTKKDIVLFVLSEIA